MKSVLRERKSTFSLYSEETNRHFNGTSHFKVLRWFDSLNRFILFPDHLSLIRYSLKWPRFQSPMSARFSLCSCLWSSCPRSRLSTRTKSKSCLVRWSRCTAPRADTVTQRQFWAISTHAHPEISFWSLLTRVYMCPARSWTRTRYTVGLSFEFWHKWPPIFFPSGCCRVGNWIFLREGGARGCQAYR